MFGHQKLIPTLTKKKLGALTKLLGAIEMEYTVYLRESKYRFVKIGTVAERRRKERGRNFMDLLSYARARYSLFGSPDKIVLVPRDLKAHSFTQ